GAGGGFSPPRRPGAWAADGGERLGRNNGPGRPPPPREEQGCDTALEGEDGKDRGQLTSRKVNTPILVGGYNIQWLLRS
ncbi:hypothetical protein THAOC_32118, partial [Thalassiosira oceanica]